MPRKCCIPNCNGNYESTPARVSVFEFPTNLERKNLWIREIARDGWKPSRTAVVCERHFSEEFIVRIDSVIRPDGSVLSVDRERPKLTKDAYPSIFPNYPLKKSLSSKSKKVKDAHKYKRKVKVEAPTEESERWNDWMNMDDTSFNQWIDEQDKINYYISNNQAARKQWSALRDHFQKTRKQLTKAKAEGDEGAIEKLREWYLNDSMLLLSPCVGDWNTTTTTSYSSLSLVNSDDDNELTVTFQCEAESESESLQDVVTTTGYSYSQNSSSPVPESITLVNQPPSDDDIQPTTHNPRPRIVPKKNRKRKLPQQHPSYTDDNSANERISESISALNNKLAHDEEDPDEDELFCKSLASKVKSLDPFTKLECQAEIQLVIVKYLRRSSQQRMTRGEHSASSMSLSSSIVHVEDGAGKSIKFREFNARRYPDFKPDSLKHAMDMEARTDDILLITYPKAGTHWVFEIARFLLAGTTELPIVEKDVYHVEYADRTFINGLPTDAPRSINCHYHAGDVSPDFLRKKSKIIFVSRDPRDIVCSYYNHHRKLTGYYEYEGEWADYLPLFLEGKLDYGSWFEHTKGWEKLIQEHPDHPFLVLSYEGLKTDPYSNVKKIADFIGTDRSEEFLKEVVDKTHFDSMAKVRALEPGYAYSVMYRKGKVGDWRNKFTVAQSEVFNEVFEKEMAGTEAYKLYSHTVKGREDDNQNAV